MALVDELLISLGYDYDDKAIGKFKSDVEKTTTAIKSFIKIAAAGSAAITGMIVTSTKASDAQAKLAREIGDTTENIDALQFASTRAGGSAEGMASSLRNLALRAGEASRGVGSGVEAFGILGISVNDVNGNIKSTSNLMLEVNRQLQGLSKAKQIELADKLGLRDSINLLQESPRAIRSLLAEANAIGVTSAKDAILAEKVQDSLVDLWAVIKQISRVLTRELAPMFVKNVKALVDWWKINRQLIEQNLPDWIAAIVKSVKLMTLAFAAWLSFKLFSQFLMLINLFKGLSLAAAATNASILLIPTLIASAVAALGLLAQDAKVFFQGGESFIGDMIEKFPQWERQIKSIAGIFSTLADLTNMMVDGWSKIFNLFSSLSFDKLVSFFKTIPGFLGDVTGISPLESRIPELTYPISNVSNSASTKVDKVEITVQGGADSSDAIAKSVFNIFQQTAQDLNSPIDQ